MDSATFDRVTRLFASSASRRGLGTTVLAVVATRLGAVAPADVAAHNRLRRCRKIEDKKKRAKCIKAAKRHNARHRAIKCAKNCPDVEGGKLRCRKGECVVLTCAAGRANCDDNVLTGCEINTRTDLDHCGGCDNVCPGQDSAANTVRCVAGKCQWERTFATPGSFPLPAPFTGLLTVKALGGAGGHGAAGEDSEFGSGDPGAGGQGAGGTRTEATVAVNEGDQLEIIVGGRGGDASGKTGGQGGGNGAAAGGDGGASAETDGGGGGGGGGTSEVKRGGTRLVAASGGGGGGGGAGARSHAGDDGGNGGAGGNSNGGLGGNGGSGGPGGSGSIGASGEPGEPGDGFPEDAPIVEPGAHDGSGRVTLIFEAS